MNLPFFRSLAPALAAAVKPPLVLPSALAVNNRYKQETVTRQLRDIAEKCKAVDELYRWSKGDPKPKKNLAGMKFSRWTVLDQVERRGKKRNLHRIRAEVWPEGHEPYIGTARKRPAHDP